MMMSEFIDRTGFEPTAKEYAKIEEAYYDFDGNKDAFCKAFVKDGGARKLCKARAAEIDRLNSLLLESERQYKKDMADREKRIDELTAELDRELEWKPSDGRLPPSRRRRCRRRCHRTGCSRGSGSRFPWPCCRERPACRRRPCRRTWQEWCRA